MVSPNNCTCKSRHEKNYLCPKCKTFIPPNDGHCLTCHFAGEKKPHAKDCPRSERLKKRKKKRVEKKEKVQRLAELNVRALFLSLTEKEEQERQDLILKVKIPKNPILAELYTTIDKLAALKEAEEKS